MIKACIGLGANLGEALASLQQAAHELAATPGITGLRLSRFYRSAPVDATGPDYVNAVAEIDTLLSADALLDILQKIENQHGRLRPYRNAPRTLDLDLLLYGDLTIDTPRLTVPHPRMHERAFVLRPLQELRPTLHLRQSSLQTLLQACSDQALELVPGQHQP
ncbi:2-amino-4-hydroxy-6-hydroxymethyldihydropteridine diphosphokinase [Alcaligenaceae bacterium]|nr:2-amino-4-hydroxy-6-hydroxymethyldihydropteridine diphosphokinase [Alcaligenaceae bacterium]